MVNRIEEELKGENRANYGTEIIKKLSKELKEEYGKGFDARNLYYCLKFLQDVSKHFEHSVCKI